MSDPTSPLFVDAGVEARRIPVETATRDFMRAANRLPTLFDLDDQMYALLALLDEADPSDFDPEAALAQVDAVEAAIGKKVEGYVSVIRTLESLAEARKAEADRLKERSKMAEKNATWLRDRLVTHMKATGQERFETARFTLSIRQNPPAVVVLEAAMVPKQFERTRITIDIDKRAVMDSIKATGEIPPGIDVTRGERLDIR